MKLPSSVVLSLMAFLLLAGCADDTNADDVSPTSETGDGDGDSGDGDGDGDSGDGDSGDGDGDGDSGDGDGEPGDGDGDGEPGDGDGEPGDGDGEPGDGDGEPGDGDGDGDSGDGDGEPGDGDGDGELGNCASSYETCGELMAAFQAEATLIRSCSQDSQCGQVLVGTSCGCTRNWVARLDADTQCFYSLMQQVGELDCDPGLISTCDCPWADGFVCVNGTCGWNYL